MPTLAAQLLVPEAKTDLAGMSPLLHFAQANKAVFTPTILSGARSEWLMILQERMAELDQARTCVGDEFAYGGAGAVVGMFTDLENAVDSARRMVYALGSEMRRRSEGNLPVWTKIAVGSAVSTMQKGKSS